MQLMPLVEHLQVVQVAADVLRERGVLTQVKLKSGFDESKLTLPQFREALINTLTDPEKHIRCY